MNEFSSHAACVAALVERHGARQDALLPLLHDLQAEVGFISEEAIRALAAALNLGRAEVQGVVSFYHDFRTQPESRPVIKLCRAEACQARGVEGLIAALPDDFTQRVALDSVYCLGLCSVGPNALVGGAVQAHLDAEKLQQLAGVKS
ncbi:NAD(P)H-dependent oxidoreductase subunit E [Deinococcus fonticola]|uniref:NAD(P)H-dependent oxidoreductase subunit E n=1 Tax=Deinococcus fonticola TaxID=2528713 RepID=UPI0010753FB8|nr:NAD(P)H-dependent oxidoreductase subunit E [Deinococcus fonticola]